MLMNNRLGGIQMNNRALYPMNAFPTSQPAYCPKIEYAHAYVPFQPLTCVYPPMVGLKRWTIFPELDRPYGTDPEYLADE